MARSDPSLAALQQSNRIPLRPEGGLKRKIFRLLGIGTNRKPSTSSSDKALNSPVQTEKRCKSRILGLGGDAATRDADRLQHVRESKIRQPIDTGDAGSISFSTTSLQNSERTGGGAGSPVVGEIIQADSASTAIDNELGQFDSATTSNTSTHSPVETAKPPSMTSQTTAATSFSHVTRPMSATPIMLPPHTPASPTAPSTASLRPRMTDDASVLTLASSSKRVRRRNSFDTNASMLAIAPSSRRDSQESLQEFDSSEISFTGARRSVGSILSSKFDGRSRSIATGHSVGMGEEEEDESSESEDTGRNPLTRENEVA